MNEHLLSWDEHRKSYNHVSFWCRFFVAREGGRQHVGCWVHALVLLNGVLSFVLLFVVFVCCPPHFSRVGGYPALLFHCACLPNARHTIVADGAYSDDSINTMGAFGLWPVGDFESGA